MPPHRSLEERVADLEKDQDDVKSIVALYNAGTVIGKILWVVGGVIIGAATIWAAISGWITNHLK